MFEGTSKLTLVVATLIGGLALFVAGFIIALEVRSTDASPSLAPGLGRIIDLGTQTVGVGSSYESPLVDVSDCNGFFLMAHSDPSVTMSLNQVGWSSPDGTTRIQIDTHPGEGYSGGGNFSSSFGGSWPYLSIYIGKSSPDTVTDITAWIWCVTDSSGGAAVGGIGELPPMAGIGGSPSHNYAVATTLALVAVVAFAAGGWYARQRRLGQ